MKKINKLFLHLISSLFLSAFIFTATILIILNFKPLYYTFIKKVEVYNLYSLSFEEIKENYKHLISYLQNTSHQNLDFPYLPSSESGRFHFQEVKTIFQTVQTIAILSFGGLLTCLLGFQKILFKKTYLFISAILNFCVIGILSLLILVDFSQIFVLFHELAFNNDLWLFDYRTDPIILYLPEAFFMTAALAIVCLILVISLICLLLYYSSNKKHTPS